MYDDLLRRLFEAIMTRFRPAVALAPVNVTTGAAWNTRRPTQGDQLPDQSSLRRNG